MKYSSRKPNRKSCQHDPDYRAQIGYRLRTARCTLGWTIDDAAKYFQVTDRTWHNWESGAHRIPFAVYKLCRVLARLELPGNAWAGWSLQGGGLVTPEGRVIEPRDSAWWSLMVRNARSFTTVYHQANKLRQQVQALEARLIASGTQACASGAAAALGGEPGAGLVTYKTNQKTTDTLETPMLNRHQNDVIMEAWPTLYDYPTPLTPLHAPRPTTSESPLTPSFVLPWTPTCAVQLRYQRPNLGPLWPVSKSHLKQNSGNLSQHQNPSQSCPPSSPEPKRSGSTTSATACSGAAKGSSARTAAAKAAKLASASGGAK